MFLIRLPLFRVFACLGALLVGPNALAASVQATKNKDLPAAGNGMYSTYIDERSHFFNDELGKADPIPIARLVPELLTAIDQLSKYAIPQQLPGVHRVPHRKIEELTCGGATCAALAAYRPGEGIYIDEALEPETDIFARSVLLHELVHYVQDVSNELAGAEACDRWVRREQEAYAIQQRFLMLVGSQVRVAYSAASSCAQDKG
ncbi:MAG: hypothetical protein R3268_13275 [Acidiferrobacterales bacterium]|nr:hypothetical protein [Acidiferrobacterales bacterium]